MSVGTTMFAWTDLRPRVYRYDRLTSNTRVGDLKWEPTGRRMFKEKFPHICTLFVRYGLRFSLYECVIIPNAFETPCKPSIMHYSVHAINYPFALLTLVKMVVCNNDRALNFFVHINCNVYIGRLLWNHEANCVGKAALNKYVTTDGGLRL